MRAGKGAFAAQRFAASAEKRLSVARAPRQAREVSSYNHKHNKEQMLTMDSDNKLA